MKQAAREFWTDERCFITELINATSHPGASLARCRVTPGTLTQKHALDVDEWYVLLSGEGQIFVGGAPGYAVTGGDTVHIPRGQAQQIRNTGTVDLVFECLCMPRFTADAYRNLETEE
ncbi:MAG: cupin domain-containing protein [Pseudomonadota bacterium]